jgi:hypothetical protein
MGLEDERDAFDGGGIGALAAFGETLFDERYGVGEESDALASFACAAEVVFETLAIGGLRKHARQREFAEAARTAEQQGVRNAIAAQCAAKGGDDAFIAEEFREAHVSAAFLCDGLRKSLLDGVENFLGDMFLGAHRATFGIKARDGLPVGTVGELIIHGGGVFEVAEAGFLKILLDLGVAAGGFARDELLGLAGRDTEIEHHGFSREIVDVVFQMFDPGDESRTIGGRRAGGLMSEIRTDVAVGEDDFA